MKYDVKFRRPLEISREFCPTIGNMISLRYKLPLLFVACKHFRGVGVPRDTRNLF